MKNLFFLSFILFSNISQSQEIIFSDAEQQVYEVIVKLFDGMRAGDSAMVHSVFSDDVRMFTSAKNKEGELILREGNLQSFLNAVGTPHEEVWDEKIWNTRVNVEMGVAQVWTDYAFYVGDEFSHCGIDAFQLVDDGGWKILQLIDTRKKMNCEKPK